MDPVTDVENATQSLSYLLQIAKLLSQDDRRRIPSMMLHIYSNYVSVIPTDEPVEHYIKKIRSLRSCFVKYPTHVRHKLQSVLLEAMHQSLSTDDPRALAIYTTLFASIELSAMRNCDQCDLEIENVAENFRKLHSSIIVPLSVVVSSLRTNLPSLLSWSLCMLIFISCACNDWIEWINGSKSTILTYPDNVKELLDHGSIPQLMKIVLKLQRRRKPFPIPPPPYTLIELLFSCAVSNNFNLINRSKQPSVDNSLSLCPFEENEPGVKRKKTEQTSESSYKMDPEQASKLLSCSVGKWSKKLQSKNVDKILTCLTALNLALLDHNSDRHRQHLAVCLQSTTRILVTISHDSTATADAYGRAFSLLLQLWYRSMERRELLSILPQSYIWLAGFNCPMYHLMSNEAFLHASIWMSRFLTRYQSMFRSSILASPHWFLQFITDVVVGAIERAKNNLLTDYLEDLLCNSVLAISRALAVLHSDSPDVKPELSRALRLPLESIVSSLSISSSSNANLSRPFSQRLRDLVLGHLIRPLLTSSIDPWCLNQVRLGIRPPSAKLLLSQLIDEVKSRGDDQGHQSIKSAGEFKEPTAVGGLHTAVEKLRKRRKLD